MRKQLLEFICCPICNAEDFHLAISEENEIEIRKGRLQCSGCRAHFEIEDGILNLLVEPSPAVLKEQVGWAILEKRVVSTDELILSLPDGIGERKAAFAGQAANFHYMWSQLPLAGNEKVLDLGAGRCWATRFFARAGCNAVGMDIVDTKYVGLRTADIYIDQEGYYFERILGDMNRPPFRDQSFDLVFIAATLHHSNQLSVIIRQINRLLKPNGRVMIINEPVVGMLQGKRVDCEERSVGINEHVYRLWEYLRELHRVGWSFRLYPYIGTYLYLITKINGRLVKKYPAQLASKRVWPPFIYLQLFLSNGNFNVIGTKPNN